MAEDQCLIQYVRDNFGDEFIHIAEDGDDTYGLDYNTFTESCTFVDHSGSPVTTLALDLFGSPSPEAPSAMDSTPYLPVMECSTTATGCYSPPGEPGLQVPSALTNLQRPFDPTLKRPLLNEKEYPMLASYGLAHACQPELDNFGHQAQGFEGITLEEMLQDQFVANFTPMKSSSGISSSTAEGERAPSFWRGKSPALLMQQLKGPSLSAASSSSSEARSNVLKSPSSQQPFQQSQSPTTLATRTPLKLAGLSHRSYRSVGDMKSYTFGNSPAVEPIILSTVSKSAPTFSRQGSLPPLGDMNIDTKFKNILSPGRRSPGQRVLQSKGSFKGDGETMQGNIKQRRKIMPGLAISGEMQRNDAAASQGANNSWSSSGTSPDPNSSRNVDHDKDQLAANFYLITPSVHKNNIYSSSAPAMSQGTDRVWKKAKGELGSPVSEDAVQVAILATAMVEQKEKNQLREKFLALLQIDSSTSKDYKAQILDDTIRYLKDLRRRLNFNEADSTPNSLRIIPESGFQADESTEASPTTSSRCRQYDEVLASPICLKDLQLETAGVEISPHLTVDSGPHIEVRMMENQHVMVKLTAKDRPGLFNDIVVVLRSLRLDIQHANIRTGNNGQRHDIFAAKMQLPFFSSPSTHSIAMALNQVISASATPLDCPEPHAPQI